MKAWKSPRNKVLELFNRPTNDSNDDKVSLHEQKFKMEVVPKFEPEDENVDTECGAGDNTDSADATLSNSNTVFMLDESKCEEADVSEQKEVIDISNGYVELTPLYDQNQSPALNGTDCVYSGFQMIPSSNCSGEESTVLAYAWNQQISTVSSETSNATSLSYVTSNQYPHLQTTNANSYISSSSIAWPRRTYYAAALSNGQHLSANPATLILASNRSVSNDDNATTLYRKNERQFVTLGDVLKERQYTPSNASRQSHNEKERRRRSRMKHSCEMLRSLVPGVSEKTDKATVLEQTVKYLMQLQHCISLKCNDCVPEVPSNGTPKLQFITTPLRYDPSMQIHTDSQLEEHQYLAAQKSRSERDDNKENEQQLSDASSN